MANPALEIVKEEFKNYSLCDSDIKEILTIFRSHLRLKLGDNHKRITREEMRAILDTIKFSIVNRLNIRKVSEDSEDSETGE